MNFAPPRLPWVTEPDYAKYKDAMLQTYIYQDGIIGEFLDVCGEETVVMIASDHGFKSGQGRPKLGGQIGGGHAAFWHQLYGIVALYGPGIRKGYTLDGATVLDLLPTILALEGLPQAADMPGKVLVDAFEPGLADDVNTQIAATLNRKRDLGDVPQGVDAATEETLKKLEALGYITPENPDAHNNLGQRYQEQGKYEEAIEEFKKALALNPNFPSALNNIGVCYGRTKQFGLAEQSFKKALALKPNDVYAMNNLAIMNLELGRLDEAARYGEMAVEVEPNYANGRLTLGSVYATAGRFEDAETQFLKVVELEPGNRRARANLQRVRQEMESR
jgi:Flp pilus assembly protein TadD